MISRERGGVDKKQGFYIIEPENVFPNKKPANKPLNWTGDSRFL